MVLITLRDESTMTVVAGARACSSPVHQPSSTAVRRIDSKRLCSLLSAPRPFRGVFAVSFIPALAQQGDAEEATVEKHQRHVGGDTHRAGGPQARVDLEPRTSRGKGEEGDK